MKKLSVLIVLVLVVACTASYAYLTPSRNLSEMIRNSGPWNGVNPTLRPGELYLPLPIQLNDVPLKFQNNPKHYRGGVYKGFLEKGDYVFLWAKDMGDYIRYTLSRARCGNPPTCQVSFRAYKPKKEQPQPPPEKKVAYLGTPSTGRPMLLTPTVANPQPANYNVGGQSESSYRSLVWAAFTAFEQEENVPPTTCTEAGQKPPNRPPVFPRR